MNKLKKPLSILLAMSMLLFSAVPALADGVEGIKPEEDQQILNAEDGDAPLEELPQEEGENPLPENGEGELPEPSEEPDGDALTPPQGEPSQDDGGLDGGAATKNVSFLSYKPETGKFSKYSVDCKILNDDMDEWKGWLVACGNVTIDDRVVVNGYAQLILEDGCTLTCKKGIEVEKDALLGSGNAYLTIYAQAEDSASDKGKLIATGDENSAGIGSGRCENGLIGDICGDIVIHGGEIRATGGRYGAGIGGGSHANNGTVTVYGGAVYAFGGENAAGIGGGEESSFGTGGEGGTVTVYGGSVETTGGRHGAGIGGARKGDGADFTMLGGRVKATGGEHGAGIGGGESGDGGSAVIRDGELIVTSGTGSAVIGGGYEGDGGSAMLCGGTFSLARAEGDGSTAQMIGSGDGAQSSGTVSIETGRVAIAEENGSKVIINSGFDPESGLDYFRARKNKMDFSVVSCGDPVTYRAYDPELDRDEIQNCESYTFVKQNVDTWQDSWYVLDDSGTFTEPVTVKGNVSLIIENGKTLTADAGIRVEADSSLTIYARPEGSEACGRLIANGTDNCAGIGCVDTAKGGSVTIHGCDVIATGGSNAAGIGGGNGCSGSAITLYGGTLTATAGAGALRAVGAGQSGGADGSFAVRKGHILYDLKTKKAIDSDPYLENRIDLIDGSEVSVCLTVQEPVAYQYYNDDMELTDAECTAYRILTGNETELKDGCWYVVKDNVTFPQRKRLKVGGNVHLILCNGGELNVPTPGNGNAGVVLPKGSSLTVYGQQGGGGSMTVIGGDDGSGIGGGFCEDGGTLSVHGGHVTAYGGTGAAAIGGGYGGNGGEFNLYGGTVIAQNIGKTDGVGIGSGSRAVISYERDPATGEYKGVFNTTAGKVNIYGGTVIATGKGAAPGIGGGSGCNGGEVRVYGGSVMATSGSGTVAAIGDGASVTEDNEIIRPEGGSVTVFPAGDSQIRVTRNDEKPIDGSPFIQETEIIELLKVVPGDEPGQQLVVITAEKRQDGRQESLGEYTVSFELNGHGEAIAALSVKNGQKADKPADPSAKGYTFGGWFADEKLTKAFDFDSAIVKDTTLYAKWTKNTSGGNGGDGSKASGSGKGAPKTGDESHAFVWGALMLVSAAGLAGAICGKRKRKAK